MKNAAILGLALLVATSSAVGGTATFSSDSDDVAIPGSSFSGSTWSVTLATNGIPATTLPTDGSGGLMNDIAPGPFTYTIMFDGAQTINFPPGGRMKLHWLVDGTTSQSIFWESFGTVAGGTNWIVASDATVPFPPTGSPVTVVAGMRIDFDGTTVTFEYSANGTDWIALPETIDAASIPAGNYTFRLELAGGPGNTVVVDEVTLTGANIPDVNQGGGGGDDDDNGSGIPTVPPGAPVAGAAGLALLAALLSLRAVRRIRRA